MKIVKRDSSVVEFNKEKISNAIIKSMKAIGSLDYDIAKLIASDIEKEFESSKETPTVKLVEDLVYDKLIKNKLEWVAKSYESYRSVQEFKRETNTSDESIIGLLHGSNDEVLRENSNKDAMVAWVMRDLLAGEVSKDISRRKLIPSHLVQAHDQGILHIHDMDYLIQGIHNCMLINLEDMLNNGTIINKKLVEKPKSFMTACTVTTQIIAQIASGQYGKRK